VIHRDVKPQNILLTESGEAKVADFGLARAAAAVTITQEGAILGTAHYLSPEQALGQPASPQSDLYSLGVVLYEMLTGKLPHDAETPVGVLMKHVSGQLRLPKEVNPNVPEEINAVTVRLLARDPKYRYQDASDLIDDFERVQQEKSPALVVQQDAGQVEPLPHPPAQPNYESRSWPQEVAAEPITPLEEMEPTLEVAQRVEEGRKMTGLEAEEMTGGKVKVAQEIEKGEDVTGVKIRRIGPS